MVVEKLNLNQRVVCGVQKDFAATQQGTGLRWIYSNCWEFVLCSVGSGINIQGVIIQIYGFRHG